MAEPRSLAQVYEQTPERKRNEMEYILGSIIELKRSLSKDELLLFQYLLKNVGR